MSLFCWGAFSFIRSNWPQLATLEAWYWKPVFTCIVCSATIWGNIAYWLLPQPSIGEWLVAWVACSGLNWFISHWFDV